MLHLTVNQGEGVPIYLQLVQQIKRLIATERLGADSELPPVRVFAQQLVPNPNAIGAGRPNMGNLGLTRGRRRLWEEQL